MLQEAVRTEVPIPPPPPPPRLQPRKPLTLVTAQRAVALDEFETFVGVSPNVAALKEFIAVQSSDRGQVDLPGCDLERSAARLW